MTPNQDSPKTQPALIVRAARQADLSAIQGLTADFRDHLGRPTPTDAELGHSVDRLLQDPEAEFLLALSEKRAIGVVQLRYRFSLWTGRPDCWLEDLYVDPEHRRQGVGRSLAEAAIRDARARGCLRVELDVEEENHGARRLYQGLGFSTSAKAESRSLLLGLWIDS